MKVYCFNYGGIQLKRMLDIWYIKKLEKYIGRKIKIINQRNKVKVIEDVEMQYILEEDTPNHYSFYCVERGKPSLIANYSSAIKMKRNFAIIMKGRLGDSLDYSKLEEFRQVEDRTELEKLMELYIGKEYYSIIKPEKRKINLEYTKDQKYNIYVLWDENQKYYFEQNAEAPFAFFRFYTTALSFKSDLEDISQYQKIFRDKIESEEIFDILTP